MNDMIYTVFIAEDKIPARELLTGYILGRSELTLKGTARDGREAFEKLSEKKYDLLFLDVDMPFLNGIQVLEGLESPPRVIFTTSFDKYAIKAFDLCAIDYLLKPFTRDRFNVAVDKALSRMESPDKSNCLSDIGLSFKEKNRYRILPFEDIVYISSHERKTVIHTEEKCFEMNSLLKDVALKLPVISFMRIHKQYIINKNRVKEFEHVLGSQYRIYLNDDDETALPVGQSYVPDIKEMLAL